MKKLMLTAAIVCAAVMSQAAVANWKVQAANIYDGAGDSAAKWSGAAYFFDADTITQAALFSLFDADNGLDLSKQSGYLSTGVVASGTIAAATVDNQFSAFTQGDEAHNFFFVLVDEDMMYLSKSVSVATPGTDKAQQIGFGTQSPTTGATSKSLPTDGFVAAGQWAQSAAVPEPTSGLLMLLGMAGLALRRRRA